jgi:hypothetical protein
LAAVLDRSRKLSSVHLCSAVSLSRRTTARWKPRRTPRSTRFRSDKSTTCTINFWIHIARHRPESGNLELLGFDCWTGEVTPRGRRCETWLAEPGISPTRATARGGKKNSETCCLICRSHGMYVSCHPHRGGFLLRTGRSAHATKSASTWVVVWHPMQGRS